MIIIFDITRTRAVLHIGKRVLYENSRPNLPQLTVAAGPAMIANASPIVTPTAEAEYAPAAAEQGAAPVTVHAVAVVHPVPVK